MAIIVLKTMIEAKEKNWNLQKAMGMLAVGFVNYLDDPDGGGSPMYPYGRSPGNGVKSSCWKLKQKLQQSGASWGENWWTKDLDKLEERIEKIRNTLGNGWWNVDPKNELKTGGSGSVMRVYPVGIVFADDIKKVEEWSVAQSQLTHNDPIAIAASAAMGVGISYAINDMASGKHEPKYIFEKMVEVAGKYSLKTADMMRNAVSMAKDNINSQKVFSKYEGWAGHDAIAATSYIFVKIHNDVGKAILLGVNTPGDSDTLGTMAGALVAAYGGRLNYSWHEKLENKNELSGLAYRASELIPGIEKLYDEFHLRRRDELGLGVGSDALSPIKVQEVQEKKSFSLRMFDQVRDWIKGLFVH
jgi:ADP-ribosylglycohydrolase